jgi:hypothetical protein
LEEGVDGRDKPGHDVEGSVKTSERQRGKDRCALKPATASDSFAAPGKTSRRFNSQGSFAA